MRAALAALLCVMAGAAHAAAITNLDTHPHSVIINNFGHYEPAIIGAGETLRIPGKLVVRFAGREVRMNADEEYAIWKDGSFGPQMRMRTHSHPRHF